MFGDRRMFLKFVPLFAILQATRCSIVVDNFSQKGIYIADYCPRMEYCPEGAHVMCMYYDPNHEMGPRCSNPQNLTITPVLANQLLEISNAIRSKIANGRETGFNGTRLPRGYGIFRLKWDNELATFAQVLANQCVLKHDLCRATKRFPDPGQTAGLVRFTHPDWIPIAKISSIPNPGLDDSKLAFSVTQTLKNWYMKKAHVTEDMILRYPADNTKNTDGRLYMEMINGGATHMGCGISGYTEFTFYNTKRSMNYNSIQVICNFSSRPQPGGMTYSVVPSPGSSTCGCPEGSQEDSDCLCNEVRSTNFRVYDNRQTEGESCPNQEANCEPTVVLLPIFTVEDAPPNKLIDQANNIRDPLSRYINDRLDNGPNAVLRASALKVADFFDDSQRSFQQPNALQQYPVMTDPLSSMYQVKSVMRPPLTNFVSRLPAQPLNRDMSLHQGYANGRSEPAQRRMAQSPRQANGHGANDKKSSIFGRVAQFKLPVEEKNINHYGPIKTDVKPRKDFKNIQKAVNDYIKQRSNKYRQNEIITNKHHENLRKVSLSTTPKIEENTETILSNVEEKLINFDHFDQRTNMSVDDNNKHFDVNYEESDNKLMTLLDTLEREVKHIELDGNEKEIFDAKIRKIYDSVVGKPETLLSPKARPKSKSSPKLKSNLHPPLNMLESDFKETNTYNKHELNHITESYDDFQIRHESDHLSGDNRRAYKQEDERMMNEARDLDDIDTKYNDKIDWNHIRKEDKEPDGYETKAYYENEMLSDTDHKLFSDIESKYNDRLAPTYSRNKLDQRYRDNDDKFGGKYDVVGNHKYAPSTSRKRNNIEKFEDMKSRPTSEESRKLRGFDKYREKDTIGNIRNDHERNQFRNDEDDRIRNVGDRKRVKEVISRHEFDQNDPLSVERKQYYQDKLETLERRLGDRTVRRNKYDDVRPNERALRRVRPNLDQSDRQRSKTQGDSFYMPDRARFLHGF